MEHLSYIEEVWNDKNHMVLAIVLWLCILKKWSIWWRVSVCFCALGLSYISVIYMNYPPVIKHGLLENTLFIADFPIFNPPFIGDFPASHVWWNQRVTILISSYMTGIHLDPISGQWLGTCSGHHLECPFECVMAIYHLEVLTKANFSRRYHRIERTWNN